MKLIYNTRKRRYEVQAAYSERKRLHAAGFRWVTPGPPHIWASAEAEHAVNLIEFADRHCERLLESWIQRRDTAIQASSKGSGIGRTPMGDCFELRPSQEACVEYAKDRRSVLIADEMGLGKTAEAIALLNALPEAEALPAVVVCPASLTLLWQRELERLLTHPGARVAILGRRGTPDKANVFIVSYDTLAYIQTWMGMHRWAVVIADEAHYAKTLKYSKGKWRGTARAKALQRISSRASRKVFLTGTPQDRPRDIWPLLSMLDPERWPADSFQKFGLRYCAGRRTRWGWDYSGASNLDELQVILRSTVMIRRLKRDVLAELPPKTRQIIRLEPSTELLFEAAWTDSIDDVLDFDATVPELIRPEKMPAFEAMSAARHQTAMLKVDRVAEFVADVLENERKVLVFAYHTDVLRTLERMLKGFGVVVVDGPTPIQERQAAVDRFQADPDVRVFLGQFEAAGVGYTLTAARTVVCAEQDWRPSIVTQAEDRAHRIGQTDPVTVYHVVLDRSIDVRVAELLIEKQRNVDATLDS